ncbi:AraC family transcriptional regulator [Glaciimonas sp. PCH181]|nr:hypothetical protein C7W93_05480 [Glaciimonas sp. PCH181]
MIAGGVTKLKLGVIASTVGYSSQASFTRAFVQYVGMPPSEWRKQSAG